MRPGKRFQKSVSEKRCGTFIIYLTGPHVVDIYMTNVNSSTSENKRFRSRIIRFGTTFS